MLASSCKYFRMAGDGPYNRVAVKPDTCRYHTRRLLRKLSWNEFLSYDSHLVFCAFTSHIEPRQKESENLN